MNLTEEDYEEFLEIYEDEELPNPTTENCSVSVCEIGEIGFMKYDGTLKLKQVFNDVDVYDLNGSIFLIVKDEKALFISEPISFDNEKEYIDYILGMGDVEKEKIDKKIYDSKTDWYVSKW